MSDRPTLDQLLFKAREFTNVEDSCLDAWLTAENLGLDELAARILDAGLMTEHFNSLLEADVHKRTSEEQGALIGLHETFEKTLNELAQAKETKSETHTEA